MNEQSVNKLEQLRINIQIDILKRQNIQTHTNRKWQRRLDAAKAAFGMPFSGIRSQEKKAIRYQEQDQQKAAAYQEEIKDIPPEKIACVDECGIDTYLYREYGYAAEKGTVIVMDNASFHSKKRLVFAIQNAGCWLLSTLFP